MRRTCSEPRIAFIVRVRRAIVTRGKDTEDSRDVISFMQEMILLNSPSPSTLPVCSQFAVPTARNELVGSATPDRLGCLMWPLKVRRKIEISASEG